MNQENYSRNGATAPRQTPPSASRLPWRRCAVVGVMMCVVSAATAQNLTPQQSRGRQIYVHGTSQSGKEILAYIGEGSLEVPADSMPCASCHGLDGRGKSEGGINPSVLTWETLSKPYGVKHASGREHPPYTGRALELAITRGLDPGGNKLLNVMPRYVMSREDMSDLISYLQILGTVSEPGVTENKIVIGTLVPDSGALAEFGKVVTAVTRAVLDELNSQGGIYGRKLELQVMETAATPGATRAKIEPLLKQQQVFALSGAVIAGLEAEVVPLLAQLETPLVGPLTLQTQSSSPLNRQVFYLFSGLDRQALSLIHFIEKRPDFKNAGLAMVHSRTDINLGVVDAIKNSNKKDGASLPHVVGYAVGGFDAGATVKQLRDDGAEEVLFLGNSDDMLALLREAERVNWFPTVLVPGATVGTSIFSAPSGFDRRVFFSLPTSPDDQTADAMKEFRGISEKYKLPSTHLAAQISAYSAVKILTEAIKRSGKDLSREKLIQVLEGFYDYSTGLTPAITYGPNRRVGASGAYVVTIDLKEKKFLPASGWIESN